MKKDIRRPFSYPFRGYLIDEYGQLSDIKLPYSRFSQVCPNVFVSTKPTARRPTGEYVLCNCVRTLSLSGQKAPKYIGRGMIRLYQHDRIECDTILSLDLDIIEAPNRRFGSIEWADFVWDDESMALVEETAIDNESGQTTTRLRPLFADGRRSSITFRQHIEDLSLRSPRGRFLPIFSEGERGSSVYDSVEDRIRNDTAGGSVIAWTEQFTAIAMSNDNLSIYNAEGDCVNVFTDVPGARLTSNNRVVTSDRSQGLDGEGIRVWSAEGELLRYFPDRALTRGRLFHRMGIDFGRLLTTDRDRKHFIHDADLAEIAALPEDCYQVTISPDGYLFTANGGSRGLNWGQARLFRCFTPNGDLEQAFCHKTPEEYRTQARLKIRRDREADDRRHLRFMPRTFTHKETIYAANAPHCSGDIYYSRTWISGDPDAPGQIFVVPVESGQQLCPVCGSPFGTATFGPHSSDSHFICSTCRLHAGLDDIWYDECLDSQYGGQFGVWRKAWLDRTGWRKEDLDRLERVFGVDTSTWPRPEPNA